MTNDSVRPFGTSRKSTATTVLLGGAIIAALYFGRELFVPFALALLLTFLLTPLATALARLRLGRVFSGIVALSSLLLCASAIFWLGAIQLADMVVRVPQYQENVRRKVDALQAGRPGLAKALDNLQQLASSASSESAPPDNQATPSRPARGVKPLPVQIVRRQTTLLETLGLVSTPVLRLAAQAVVVVVLTLFMLIQRCDLRDRLLRLLGVPHLQRATSALDDAGHRISRYLLAQSCVNMSFGLLLGIGLYFIGVPNAVFWGAAGAVLRFIPYLGTLVAGGAPFLLSLAALDGWMRPVCVLLLFIGIEALISAVVEPWLYGAHTGLSSLAVLLSASFWTLLWGPLGLVLAMPLTVCLLVVGRHAPPLRFLSLLLGDEPVLEPSAAYYQRLLALDDEDAQAIIRTASQKSSPLQICDSILIPALSLAERDRHRGNLEPDQHDFISETTRSFIDEFADQLLIEPPNPAGSIDGPVLCLPSRDDADELVCSMLLPFLRRAGFHAESHPLISHTHLAAAFQQYAPAIVVVSALPPYALNPAYQLCKQIRSQFPKVKVVIGYWDSSLDRPSTTERLQTCTNAVATSLAEALDQVQRLSSANPELVANASVSELSPVPA